MPDSRYQCPSLEPQLVEDLAEELLWLEAQLQVQQYTDEIDQEQQKWLATIDLKDIPNLMYR